MSLLVWATGGVQWDSGLSFSCVCYNSTWDFNSASCFNLHRTILRGFVIKSTKSWSGLSLTSQQNTSLCQKKNNAKYNVHFVLEGLCIYTCFTYMDWTVTTSIISVRGWHGSHDKHHQHLFAPYKSQCLTDFACMTALPTQDRESTACTSLPCVSPLKLRVFGCVCIVHLF